MEISDGERAPIHAANDKGRMLDAFDGRKTAVAFISSAVSQVYFRAFDPGIEAIKSVRHK